MNERIKELAGHAKVMAEESINKKISRNAELDAFAEKFVELIVRECAQVCFDKALKQAGNGVKVLTYNIAGEEIMQHFGVEE